MVDHGEEGAPGLYSLIGGKLADGKVIAPGEVRGSQIAGDTETRQLSKGDVVIVPAGVPHWFKEVSSPFNYYVVKAR